ncbi:MAG: hypothetical protein IKR69_04405 [Bacteroidales bacterium]|nr:hypothetical protein [Bacteroidales bacterium]
MKKSLITLIFGVSAIVASAQTMQDVYSFSENIYGGTARSVGMGNAMSAVGSDMGSVTINPAGSAVAGYSQMTITPGFSVSNVTASGILADQPDGSASFEQSVKQTSARMTLPDFGFVLNLNGHRSSGLKNISFGFLGNSSNNFLNNMVARGTNGYTSYAGSLASLASGWQTSEITGDNPYFDHDAPWSVITGYGAFIIDNQPDGAGGSLQDQYIGVTEKFIGSDIGLAGIINQGYGVSRIGNKYDFVFNFAMNFSDIVYIGANLGLVSMRYRESEYWSESAVNMDDFVVNVNGNPTRFDRFDMDYQYNVDGTGVYGKLGVIVRPAGGLRIGLTAQTPTAMNLVEKWSFDAKTHFEKGSESASSEEAESRYRLSSPAIFGAGLAYTIGSFGLVSVDYEFRDFSWARLHERYVEDRGYFDGLNQDIRQYFCASHAIRAGLEVRPIPSVAIRAGYNYNTYGAIGANGKRASYLDKHAFSIGGGWSSRGSFFADLAVRVRTYREQFQPYNYYSYDSSGHPGIDDRIACPLIESRSVLVDTILTLGFRF